jgi:hypothetical protein
MTSKTNPFETLRQATYCPFAKTANVRFAPMWDRLLTPCDNIRLHAETLSAFVRVAEKERIQGFVSEVVIGSDAQSFEGVRCGFRDYLADLAMYDEDCRRTLDLDKLGPKWQFSFAGMRMFLNVFASCYKQPHSKFIASDNSFWVLFQPEFSFGLCGVDSSRGELKQQIREKFSSRGMPYNGAMIDRRIEALLYMFPQHITCDPVRWWVG